MKTTYWSEDDTLHIQIADELGNHEARACIEAMQIALALYPGEPIMLDLSELTFTDSSGLAVLINLHRAAQKSKRVLTIRGTRTQAMRVFRAAGLQKMMHFE